MNEPRDLIQCLEKNPQLPEGDGEILSVYGVEPCPFASGVRSSMPSTRRFILQQQVEPSLLQFAAA